MEQSSPRTELCLLIKNRVLVVDDDESIRELTLLLRKEGYEVTAAENGF
jgi:CheY-like chemotaxis protein